MVTSVTETMQSALAGVGSAASAASEYVPQSVKDMMRKSYITLPYLFLTSAV